MTWVIAFLNHTTAKFEFPEYSTGDYIHSRKDTALKQFKLELRMKGTNNVRLLEILNFELSSDITLI